MVAIHLFRGCCARRGTDKDVIDKKEAPTLVYHEQKKDMPA